jgi:hypothetical protein
MNKRLLSYQIKGESRWSWALYYSGYSGFGFRFHRVRDNTSRRWNIFFDIPVIGGLSLYIQDIP